MPAEQSELDRIEDAWGVKLPDRFSELYECGHWNRIGLPDGSEFNCPMTLLSCSAIVSARSTAEDWEIPDGLVPFMGGFHDLLCLDYQTGNSPSVVALDDDRNIRPLFDSIVGLLEAPKIEDSSGDIDLSGIVEEKTWFKF